MDIRLYFLIIFGFLAVYSFIIIYIESQKSIRQSDRIKREAILIYTGNEKAKEFSYKYKDITITGKPQYIYENKAGELILIYNEYDFNENDINYYKYKICADFLAVEAEYKRTPVYAIIESIRTGKHITVENNLELRNETLELVKEMKNIIEKEPEIELNHNEIERCQNCLYKVDCSLRIE